MFAVLPKFLTTFHQIICLSLHGRNKNQVQRCAIQGSKKDRLPKIEFPAETKVKSANALECVCGNGISRPLQSRHAVASLSKDLNLNSMHYVSASISTHRRAMLCIRVKNQEKMISMQQYALRISGGGILVDASAVGRPIGKEQWNVASVAWRPSFREHGEVTHHRPLCLSMSFQKTFKAVHLLSSQRNNPLWSQLCTDDLCRLFKFQGDEALHFALGDLFGQTWP